MRRLHLVGFTSELDGLIFSGSDGDRSGSYVVELDDEVLAAVREVLARRDARRTGPVGVPGRGVDPTIGRAGPTGSSLSPREIQARLRAGRSIGEVALEAGVEDEWVRRFAAPVFAEQIHVVHRALESVLDEGDGPASSASLHESVLTNLAGRGLIVTDHELSSAWSAFQIREASWVVQLRALIGHEEVVARWAFDTRAGGLVALDATAADLGWIDASGRGRAAAVATRGRAVPVAPPAANGVPAPAAGGPGPVEAPDRTDPAPADRPTADRPAAARRAATRVAPAQEPVEGKGRAVVRAAPATVAAAPAARRARPTGPAPEATAKPRGATAPAAQEALPLRVPARRAPAPRPSAPER